MTAVLFIITGGRSRSIKKSLFSGTLLKCEIKNHPFSRKPMELTSTDTPHKSK
jgi:hypothetical protein